MPRYSAGSRLRHGFSLVELTLVLAIVGLLLAGLFELTAASSRQVNNQVTAQQLQIYLKAVKSWMIGTKSGSDAGTFAQYSSLSPVPNGKIITKLGEVYNVTGSVQGFKAIGYGLSMLPKNAPNGGKYIVGMQRVADVGNKASFIIVVSVVNGGGIKDYNNLQLGSIATFTGGEGAAIYPIAGNNAVQPDDPACNGANNVIGAFGGQCYSMDNFTAGAPAPVPFQTSRPATLSYVNMVDIANSNSDYLWRVTPPGSTDLNKMTVDFGMGLGNKASVTPNPDILFNGNGSIAMDGGDIIGVQNLTLKGGASSAINTNGGRVNLGDSAGNAVGLEAEPAGYAFTDSNGVTATYGAIRIAPAYLLGSGANFSGTVEANGFYARQFIYNASDRRLKKDIQDLHGVLPALARLNGKRYILKSNDHADIGLIAQDVQQVFPELVAEREGHLVMNYQGMVGPLVTGVNELAKENAALNKRVTRLELLLSKQRDEK